MGRTDAVDWVEAGREFSAEEIGEIRKMVAWLPGLARKELAATVCEHLQWHTAAGPAKLQACQKLLERLEAAGLLELPALRRKKNHNGNRCVVALSERTATDRPLAGPLRELEPVRLEVVTEASDVGLWSEYVERFHPLGYKGAFGYRLRYFIRSGTQRLGCVLLAGAARAIAVGDRWIGWNERARLRNLPRVIDNSRFLNLCPRSNPALGQPCAGAVGPTRERGLAAPMGILAAADGDLRGPASVYGYLLPGRWLEAARADQRPRAGTPWKILSKHAAAGVGQALGRRLPLAALRRTVAGEGGAMSKPSRRPRGEDIKAQRRKKNQQEKALRDRRRCPIPARPTPR
jgi:hypothetical protein